MSQFAPFLEKMKVCARPRESLHRRSPANLQHTSFRLHTAQAEGLNESAIKAFEYNYEKLSSGANLMVGEDAIAPVAELPSYDTLTDEKPALLTETVMLKLNGGLGTGMGLEKAKSLLPLKGDLTFLDFIALQASAQPSRAHMPTRPRAAA